MSELLEALKRWNELENIDGHALAQSVAMVGRTLSIEAAINADDEQHLEVSVTYQVKVSDFDFAMQTHSR